MEQIVPERVEIIKESSLKMPIMTRLATAADQAMMEAITDAAYTKYIARIGRKPQPMTTDYRAMIASAQVWLAEANEECVGLIVLQPQQDALLLYSVAVLPAYQGKGVGRTLLLLAEAEARRQGFTAVRLYTNERMTENIARYTRIGYSETHRVEYNGYHIVYMEKQL